MKRWRYVIGASSPSRMRRRRRRRIRRREPHAVPERIPTTRPTRGDIDVRIHTMGELGPRRSMTMAAPSVGGMLQIVTLSPAGSVVKEGDVVIRFDQAEQQFNLQQAESELAEAEQAIVKMKADARVQVATDALNLLHARHELRRAEIAVSGNEFVGKIEAEKNNLTLEQAKAGAGADRRRRQDARREQPRGAGRRAREAARSRRSPPTSRRRTSRT